MAGYFLIIDHGEDRRISYHPNEAAASAALVQHARDVLGDVDNESDRDAVLIWEDDADNINWMIVSESDLNKVRQSFRETGHVSHGMGKHGNAPP